MANKSKYPIGCGIYAIEHIESGKRYIGSSQKMEKRLPTHVWKLRKGIHHSAHLQSAWNLYGEANFKFVLVLRCESVNDLLECEQLEIEIQDATNNGYNCAKFAGAPMRGRIQGVETREKMRESHKNRKPISEETRARMKLASIEREAKKKEDGRVVSIETREKLSQSGKGRLVSEEVREKISIANKGHVLTKEQKAKQILALTGRKLTDEHKKAVSDAGKKRWKRVREGLN